jgi:hypothetical protein
MVLLVLIHFLARLYSERLKKFQYSQEPHPYLADELLEVPEQLLGLGQVI